MSAAGPTASTIATPDILHVATEAELRQRAESQISGLVAGEIAPLQSGITTEAGRETRAVSELNTMFGSLLPFVADSAQRVADNYATGTQVQGQIFTAAAEQLAALKQERAQRAQALAQEMGAPVAVDDFLKPLEGVMGALPNEAAASQLYALGQAQAGTQYAESFAGKVFPALKAETELRTRSMYEERINTLQDQINSIQSQKSSMVDQRYADLLASEREVAIAQENFQLAQLQADRDYQMALQNLELDRARMAADSAQSAASNAASMAMAQAELKERAREADISHSEFLAQMQQGRLDQQHTWDLQSQGLTLDKLKADRDWKVAQRQLHQDAQRINLAKKQFGLETAGTTGTYKGKPTLEKQKLTKDWQLANKQLKQAGIQIKQKKSESDRDYHQRVIEANRNYKLKQQELKNQNATQKAKFQREDAKMRIAQMETARNAVQQIMTGGGKESGTYTKWEKVKPPSKINQRLGKIPAGTYQRADGTWVHPVTVHTNVQSRQPVHNPTKIYKMLIQGGIPRSIALSVVQARFNGWKP